VIRVEVRPPEPEPDEPPSGHTRIIYPAAVVLYQWEDGTASIGAHMRRKEITELPPTEARALADNLIRAAEEVEKDYPEA
jgi:hypothetical protein